MKLWVNEAKLTGLWATIRDKSSWHSCLKRTLFSTISFIYFFNLFKCRKCPHPRINVVCCKKNDLRASNWLRLILGKGVGVHRGRRCRRGHFNTFAPHCCNCAMFKGLWFETLLSSPKCCWAFEKQAPGPQNPRLSCPRGSQLFRGVSQLSHSWSQSASPLVSCQLSTH